MPNNALPQGSSIRAAGSASGGSPATQRSRISCASDSHEVLVNEDPQFPLGGFGHQRAVGENGVRERGTAFAGAGGRHFGHGFGHHLARVLGVLHEVGNDVGHGYGVVFFVPAIVIGHHGDGDVADLGLAGEL